MTSDRYGVRTYLCLRCNHYFKNTYNPSPDSYLTIVDTDTGQRLYLSCEEIIVKHVIDL